jgi:hypothetical protein
MHRKYAQVTELLKDCSGFDKLRSTAYKGMCRAIIHGEELEKIEAALPRSQSLSPAVTSTAPSQTTAVQSPRRMGRWAADMVTESGRGAYTSLSFAVAQAINAITNSEPAVRNEVVVNAVETVHVAVQDELEGLLPSLIGPVAAGVVDTHDVANAAPAAASGGGPSQESSEEVEGKKRKTR